MRFIGLENFYLTFIIVHELSDIRPSSGRIQVEFLFLFHAVWLDSSSSAQCWLQWLWRSTFSLAERIQRRTSFIFTRALAAVSKMLHPTTRIVSFPPAGRRRRSKTTTRKKILEHFCRSAIHDFHEYESEHSASDSDVNVLFTSLNT